MTSDRQPRSLLTACQPITIQYGLLGDTALSTSSQVKKGRKILLLS